MLDQNATVWVIRIEGAYPGWYCYFISGQHENSPVGLGVFSTQEAAKRQAKLLPGGREKQCHASDIPALVAQAPAKGFWLDGIWQG